jgi:site-specific recombinase XerD
MEKTLTLSPPRPVASRKDVDKYIRAGTANNTRRAYQNDIRHFQEWGGLLPSSREQVCQYLVSYAESLSVNTLCRRLAGLSVWHKSQGFADPTVSLIVKKVMHGIRRQHNTPPKKATPLSLKDLTTVVACIDQEILGFRDNTSITIKQEQKWLKLYRDKAMLLIGFWRGFRADTLVNLRREFIRPLTLVVQGKEISGLGIFLPHSKVDQQARGEEFVLPAMDKNTLCPVQAYQDWLQVSGLQGRGYAFPKKNHQGLLTHEPLSANTLGKWLKRLCEKSGIEKPEQYSSHSLRRGLATLMARNGADAKVLMEYIGWKSANSALGYVDAGTEGAAFLLEAVRNVQ